MWHICSNNQQRRFARVQLEQLEQVRQMRQVRQVRQTADELLESELEHEDECNLVEIQTLLREAEHQGVFSFAALTASGMKLAALLHDVGKPATFSIDDKGAVHFYGHPQTGVPLALQVMKRLRASTHDCRLVKLMTAHHMRPGQLGLHSAVTRTRGKTLFCRSGTNWDSDCALLAGRPPGDTRTIIRKWR